MTPYQKKKKRLAGETKVLEPCLTLAVKPIKPIVAAEFLSEVEELGTLF